MSWNHAVAQAKQDGWRLTRRGTLYRLFRNRDGKEIYASSLDEALTQIGLR